MHLVRLNIEDSVFDKVIYFLQNLPQNEVQIIEERVIDENKTQCSDDFETRVFSNHSANLVKEWHDSSEDDVWK
jgi:hypothetical protein